MLLRRPNTKLSCEAPKLAGLRQLQLLVRPPPQPSELQGPVMQRGVADWAPTSDAALVQRRYSTGETVGDPSAAWR
jgi:hypothetical protein